MVDRDLGLKASLSSLKPRLSSLKSRLSSLKRPLCAAIPRGAQPGQGSANGRHPEVFPTSRMLGNTTIGDGGDIPKVFTTVWLPLATQVDKATTPDSSLAHVNSQQLGRHS